MLHRNLYPSRLITYALEGDLPFALACGWSPPEMVVELHYHDLLEIGICRRGSGVIMAKYDTPHYKEGDVCVIRPYDLHFHVSSRGVRACWDFIFFDPARALASCRVTPALLDAHSLGRPLIEAILDQSRYPGLFRIVDTMVAELREKAPYYQDTVAALAVELLATLHRHKRGDLSPAPSSGHIAPRLMPAVEFVSQHYARRIAVRDLSRRCGISVRMLHRLWQAAFGRSPREYILRLRIAMVCATLAATDRSVTEIALESGFQSISSFNRQFRRRVGCSPRAWRREHRSART